MNLEPLITNSLKYKLKGSVCKIWKWLLKVKDLQVKLANVYFVNPLQLSVKQSHCQIRNIDYVYVIHIHRPNDLLTSHYDFVYLHKSIILLMVTTAYKLILFWNNLIRVKCICTTWRSLWTFDIQLFHVPMIPLPGRIPKVFSPGWPWSKSSSLNYYFCSQNTNFYLSSENFGDKTYLG